MWPAPHNNLAKLYLVQGKKKEAIDKYETAIKNNPNIPTAYLSLALLFEGDRDFPNAIAVYEQALKENPNFWFAANNLAFLLSEQSNSQEGLDRAMKLARDALRLQPGNPAILDTIGWIYFRMDDFPQAHQFIENALVRAPNSAILNYHMGMVHYKSRETDKAYQKLVKAIEGADDFYGRKVAEETLDKLKASSSLNS